MWTVYDAVVRECLIIADDLTGACDAAVHFALRGYRTAASVSALDCGNDAEVVAISTDTRDADREEIFAAMHKLAALTGRVLFKKIDSTLRGNAGIEIAAAMEAFQCDAAVITPAFPAMGRIVRDGWLHLPDDPDFKPINVNAWLKAQGVEERVASAECDSDLDRLVAQSAMSGQRILWAGSAGLAAAIARSLPARETQPINSSVEGPVLFCIGSDHKVTVEQQHALEASGNMVRFSAATTTPQSLSSALSTNQHAILQIPRGQVPAERIRNLIVDAPKAALFLCGGDTASLVCRSINAQRIELIDEVQPGLPRGILRGGELDGRTVVTKSGGFGAPDTLVQVARYFASSRGQ